MSEDRALGAFVPDPSAAAAVAAVLDRWFEVAEVQPGGAALPLHVVACDPRGPLTSRCWAAVARQAYAAGATEIWLLPDGQGRNGRLLPRLVPTAA